MGAREGLTPAHGCEVVVGHLNVRHRLHLEEKQDGRYERPKQELDNRSIVHYDHDPDQDESAKHLDELPKEEMRLVLFV